MSAIISVRSVVSFANVKDAKTADFLLIQKYHFFNLFFVLFIISNEDRINAT